MIVRVGNEGTEDMITGRGVIQGFIYNKYQLIFVLKKLIEKSKQ